MLHYCTCGGNKIIVPEMTQEEIQFPGQYKWFCDTCDKYGIGWSFGPKPHPVIHQDSKYFETQEEAMEDYRSW